MNNDNRAITTEDPCGIPFDQLILDNDADPNSDRLPTGFIELDKVFGGLPSHGLVTIAGRPAMGHRDLALSLARNLAVAFGIPTAYVSTELSEKDLARKVMRSIVAEIGNKVDVKGRMESTIGLVAAKHPPLFFESTNLYSVKKMEDLCMKLIENHNVRVIFLDSAEDLETNTRLRDFYALGRMLKGIAMRLGICIVAVSHITRAVEYRGGSKIPTISDLRAGLEIHSDSILLMYRPEYYGITEDEWGETKNRAHVYLYKAGGQINCAYLYYNSVCTTFYTGKLLANAVLPQYPWSRCLMDYRDFVRKTEQNESGSIATNTEMDRQVFDMMKKDNPHLELFQSVLLGDDESDTQ